MKLSDYSDHIRLLIDKSFRNRLGRMGIEAAKLQPIELIPAEYHTERLRMDSVREVFISETGSIGNAYEKLVEELTFTLFNRLAALKVMEAHTLFPEIITQRETHGGRSFAHLAWLEQNPHQRAEEAEGLVAFMHDQFTRMAAEIPLFSTSHPYHLLPTAIELSGIITAFNQVETDAQVINSITNEQLGIAPNSEFLIPNSKNIWQSDDVLGWLYESYNNQKKADHKASGDKTEYNKVSIQSQVYTPRWVVKFLVDNSLGKLYLEMYPDSDIKNNYKIANAPATQTRERKSLKEIRLIDPATGSGNFMLYAFDLFYDLYLDQIENYGADYDENQIAKLIIENNLHGVDLDDRAIQLAQLGLYIKAKRRKRSIRIDHFNVVSSDFWLPEYEQVKDMFESGATLDSRQKEIIRDIWTDLRQAYKFGSLIRLEEKLSIQLHGLKQQFDRMQLSMFDENTLANYEQFRDDFFINLQRAVEQNAARQGSSFLNTKTQDAITFLQLLTQKYDVAVANPPYTDSSDFGDELKTFIDSNYAKPYKFNTNLYAVFIKRCYELIDENGKMALIHPLTFMYISSFTDVRKFILNNLHINLIVDYGLSNQVFGGPAVNPAFYIMEKGVTGNSQFIKLNDLAEGKRPKAFVEAYDDLIDHRPNKHNISLPQSKLKIIEGWPFIYWISDGFREKFKEKALDDILNPRQGIATGNNDKCVRFWWEINNNEISSGIDDNKKWKFYSKGGPFNKWFGNFWTVIDFSPNGYEYLLNNGNHLPSRNFYFQEGATYSASGSKGVSFRYMPINQLFDVGGSCIFMGEYKNVYYTIAFLNSKITFYLADCLNPTVNTQVGDLKRIPFVKPRPELENHISCLAVKNIEIKKQLCSYRIIETNFASNPISAFPDAAIKDRVLSYLNYENSQLCVVLLNEAIINELIYEVYELSNEDRAQVEAKMGVSVGALPITNQTKENYELRMKNEELGIMAELREILDKHVYSLPTIEYDEDRKREIIEGLATLYQSNNDLEEFCIRNQVNPLDVCLWFSQNKVLPQARAAEITLEFLADAFRTILMEDEDGIVPLVGLPGEPRLLDRLEQHCLANGFTSAQFMQLDSLLGRPVNEYIEQYFFEDLSNLLNLFRHLPKTPFIWHLSSGTNQGFEAYLIIYKWNRDSLFKIKSQYLRDRVESLDYRLINLQGVETAAAQNEKETIRLQLREIEHFVKKIDELIAEGYNPILDDGVGKNIAPLQKKGMLKAEVLKANQLVKYLNADW